MHPRRAWPCRVEMVFQVTKRGEAVTAGGGEGFEEMEVAGVSAPPPRWREVVLEAEEEVALLEDESARRWSAGRRLVNFVSSSSRVLM